MNEQANIEELNSKLASSSCKASILCIPHAGGFAEQYYSLCREIENLSNNKLDVIALDLPGRGPSQTSDSTANTSTELWSRFIEESVASIKSKISSGKLYLYGHSLGALISFELMRVLHSEHSYELLGLGVSSSLAPLASRVAQIPTTSDMTDSEFIDFLNQYDGIPEQFSSQPELVNAFLPSLRKDFRLLENYQPPKTPVHFSFPIHAWCGDQDPIYKILEVSEWLGFSNHPRSFSRIIKDGDHFFPIKSYQKRKVQEKETPNFALELSQIV